jgi:hypothetical protein
MTILFSYGSERRLRQFLAALISAVILLCAAGPSPGTAQTVKSDWQSLSTFHRSDFYEVIGKSSFKIVLYYFDGAAARAVRYQIGEDSWEHAEAPVRDRFICLIRSGAKKVGVASCRLLTRIFDPQLIIESTPIFSDAISADEVDGSRILQDGSNEYLISVYRPYSTVMLEEFLELQRVGKGDFLASCITTLQLTAPDGIGGLSLLRTRTRPYQRAILNRIGTNGDDDASSEGVGLIHLSEAAKKGFLCDEAVTLPNDKVLIVSGNQLVALDYWRKEYGVTDLPTARKGYVLIRVMPD